MNKFKAAALEVLTEAKKPLHVKEITKRAIESGILETEGATPEQSMNAQLITDVNAKGSASDFVKTGPATFSVNPNKAKIKDPQKAIEIEKEGDEKLIVDSSFTGKAGEYRVCSELLFREYNASIMSVDVGMDIAATKENKLFSIQVKTANLNKYNAYNFDVRKVSFERQQPGTVFYIFILRGTRTDFLILPQYEMERKVHEKAILEVDNGKKYRVRITMRGTGIFLGSKKHEMGYFLNNWDIIK